MGLNGKITYVLNRVAALDGASVALVVAAGNGAGGRKDGESQHESSKSMSEHLGFVKVFEGRLVRRTKVCSTEDSAWNLAVFYSHPMQTSMAQSSVFLGVGLLVISLQEFQQF